VWMIGLDRSRNLLEIAVNAGSDGSKQVKREVVWGDVLDGCWRPGVFVRSRFCLVRKRRSKSEVEGLCYLDSYDTPFGHARTTKIRRKGTTVHLTFVADR